MARSIVFLLFLCIGFRVSAQSPVDVLHYKFEIGLSDLNDSIQGRATITVKFLEPVDTFTLDLVGYTIQKNKGMLPLLIHEDKKYAASTLFKDDKFHIIPSRKVASGDTRTYVINYRGVPADGLIISKNKFGRRTFFADNWPDRAHHWLPCVDNPADKASVEFIVTAPDHYRVVSNGVLMEETGLPDHKKRTHWKEDVPLPTKVMVIGVADFAVEQSGIVKGIPVSSWVFADNREKGFYDYATAPGILSFFTDYIGPYPYKKLANVQSKTIFGGMENAGAIFYFENSVDGKRRQDGLIAHEIAHQWFGDMATEKSFAHLWLSEGFATYMTILYMEKTHGADTAMKLRSEDREQVISFAASSDRPVVDSVSPIMSLLNANSYQKGGWILHMLRRQLGDSIFRQGVRAYYAQYAGSNAETKDLRQIFEQVSGKDLSSFFRQWLFTPGIPKLDISWTHDQSTQKITVTVKQLQQPSFQFPLEIAIQLPGRKLTETITVTQQIQSFSIPTQEKPVSVQADPGINLLFDGSAREAK